MKEENKRKIRRFKTLERKYIHNKHKEDTLSEDIVDEVFEDIISEEEIKKEEAILESTPANSVGCFKLVVIKKLPWYKKLWKGFMGILGIA